MDHVLKCLESRRSCRNFQDRQVEDEVLEKILEAGLYAPTGMNKQSPIFVAVRDKKTVTKLARMNAEVWGTDSDPFYGAPMVVVVLANRAVGTCIEDGSLAMGNLMNAAHALGVASCWIHRAKEMFDSEEGWALLEAWGIQGDYVGVGNCILGYREGEEPVAVPRKKQRVFHI